MTFAAEMWQLLVSKIVSTYFKSTGWNSYSLWRIFLSRVSNREYKEDVMRGVRFLLPIFGFRYSRSLQEHSLLTFYNSSSVILIIIVYKATLIPPHIMNKNLFQIILFILTGSMSSSTRQRFLLYQVQCRAHIDIWFYSVLYWGFFFSKFPTT